MKLYILPKGVWVASHVLIILSLIFATVFLNQVVAPIVGSWAGLALLLPLSGALLAAFASYSALPSES